MSIGHIIIGTGCNKQTALPHRLFGETLIALVLIVTEPTLTSASYLRKLALPGAPRC